jgi:hypothetical protein
MVVKRRLSIHLYELHWRKKEKLAYLEKALRALQRLASQRLEEKEAERLSKGLELVVPCPGCLLQTIKCLAFSYCYSQRKGACLYYLESEHT